MFPRSCTSPSLKLNVEDVLDAPVLLLGQYTPGDHDDVRAIVDLMIKDTRKTSLLCFSSCPKRMDPNHPWLQPVPENIKDNWRVVGDPPTKGDTEETQESLISLSHVEPPSPNSCGIHYLGNRVMMLVVVAGVKMMMPPDFKDTLRKCKGVIVAQYNHNKTSQAAILREYWVNKNTTPFTFFDM